MTLLLRRISIFLTTLSTTCTIHISRMTTLTSPHLQTHNTLLQNQSPLFLRPCPLLQHRSLLIQSQCRRSVSHPHPPTPLHPLLSRPCRLPIISDTPSYQHYLDVLDQCCTLTHDELDLVVLGQIMAGIDIVVTWGQSPGTHLLLGSGPESPSTTMELGSARKHS